LPGGLPDRRRQRYTLTLSVRSFCYDLVHDPKGTQKPDAVAYFLADHDALAMWLRIKDFLDGFSVAVMTAATIGPWTFWPQLVWPARLVLISVTAIMIWLWIDFWVKRPDGT